MNTHNRDNFEPRGKREMYRKQLMEYKIYWAKIVANSSDFGLRFFFKSLTQEWWKCNTV